MFSHYTKIDASGASAGKEPASLHSGSPPPELLQVLKPTHHPTATLSLGQRFCSKPAVAPGHSETLSDTLLFSPCLPATQSFHCPQKAPGCPAHAPHDPNWHILCLMAWSTSTHPQVSTQGKPTL